MIICYFCMLTSLCLITITGFQGYFQFIIFKASYQQFALFSTVFYMFSQTLIMFFFIGSGTAIKKEITESILITDTYEKVKKTKMTLFPHLTLNMFIIGSAFVLIGAVDTGAASNLTQNIFFLLGYIHFLFIIKIQHNAFKENIDIIIEIADVNNSKSIIN